MFPKIQKKRILKVDDSFSKEDPVLWLRNSKYGKTSTKKSKVVSDTAESGVALAENFNNTMSKDETDQQNIYQVIEEHRQCKQIR